MDEPREDIPSLRLSFRAWKFAIRYHIPEYERWLAASGSRKEIVIDLDATDDPVHGKPG